MPDTKTVPFKSNENCLPGTKKFSSFQLYFLDVQPAEYYMCSSIPPAGSSCSVQTLHRDDGRDRFAWLEESCTNIKPKVILERVLKIWKQGSAVPTYPGLINKFMLCVCTWQCVLTATWCTTWCTWIVEGMLACSNTCVFRSDVMCFLMFGVLFWTLLQKVHQQQLFFPPIK